MLTIKRLKEVLRYDPNTGAFVWRIRTSNRVEIGSVAGTPVCGYVSIHVDGARFQAHRLAWFYMTGSWPSAQLDHRNCVRSDNRWDNLREAPGSLNHENMRKARSDNSTGVLGVRKMRDRFQANIRVHGRSRNCGTYSTPELAHAAYVEAKRKLHAGCTL